MRSSVNQDKSLSEFRAFVQAEISPRAAEIDRAEQFPEDLIQKIAARGYLAPWISEQTGSQGMDFLTYGLLHAEIGRACSSARSLLTAHGMVAYAVARWGSAQQKTELLPRLVSGKHIAAFAITEPGTGSDAANPEMTAKETGDGYILDGRKSWITFGQRADVFLVLARCENGPATFLVDRTCQGLSVTPISGILGTRGGMLADLRFDHSFTGKDTLLGQPGVGFAMVAASALDFGRYCVAWGSVGLIRGCLEASLEYTASRQQFGTEIRNHQLVREKITDMMTNLRCAELLCRRAGELRDEGSPDAILETMIAKYHAALAAKKAADDAVQLHGANGVSDRYPVARFYRDAKILEIIEGSTQILQLAIAKHGYVDPPLR